MAAGMSQHWGGTSEEMLNTQFPLHRACRDGDLDALTALLREAQQGIYEEDSFYGWTPAHWAAYFGKLACLRKLMMVTRVGVDCNMRTSRFQQTPAHLAAFGGHPQSLLWLLQYGADINLQDYLGETALHKAARTGSMENVSLLCSHNARLFIRNNTGSLASEVAAMCGHKDVSLYIEEATQRPEAEKGIYQQAPDPRAVLTPSAHDVTNGGKPMLYAQQPADTDCDMEMESQDSMPCNNNTLQSCDDVTLNTGVSANHVPIAGKKRAREEVEEVQYKRVCRTEIAMPDGPNHWERQALAQFGSSAMVEMNGVSIQSAYLPHMHMQPSAALFSPKTNSAIEHEKSMRLAQGYDAMLQETLAEYHGI